VCGNSSSGAAAALVRADVAFAYPNYHQAGGSGLPTTGSAPVEKYEDPVGLALPPAALPFLDAWKRPEELVQGAPTVPMLLLRPSASGGTAEGGGSTAGGGAAGAGAGAEKKGGSGSSKAASSAAAAAAPNRELEGRLYAGHDSFDWLLAVMSAVMVAEVSAGGGAYAGRGLASRSTCNALLRRPCVFVHLCLSPNAPAPTPPPRPHRSAT